MFLWQGRKQGESTEEIQDRYCPWCSGVWVKMERLTPMQGEYCKYFNTFQTAFSFVARPQKAWGHLRWNKKLDIGKFWSGDSQFRAVLSHREIKKSLCVRVRIGYEKFQEDRRGCRMGGEERDKQIGNSTTWYRMQAWASFQQSWGILPCNPNLGYPLGPLTRQQMS